MEHHDGWDWPEDDDHDLGDADHLGDQPDDVGGHELWLDDAYDEPPAQEHGFDVAPEPGPYGEYGGVDAHVDEPLGWEDPADPGDHEPVVEYGPVFGADPRPDFAGWAAHGFPPPLDLADVPAPIDGPPWTDAELLGAVPLAEPTSEWSAPPVEDLFDYAGMAAPADEPWAALLASDDPATSALARWWGPAD